MPRMFLVALTLLMLLVACTPTAESLVEESLPAPTRTPGGPTLTPISFIPPDAVPVQASELLRFEGDGPGQAGPLVLDAETKLRVHWQQFGEQIFQIFIVNTDPNQNDPLYKKVALALSDVPSVGYTDYTLIPGEYLVMVETSQGEWIVWVEVVQP
jgi:hypothetical protein